MLELRRQTAIDPCPVGTRDDPEKQEQPGDSHGSREKKEAVTEDENNNLSVSALLPWPGMKYACLKVIQAYCKVFEQQDLYDLIVR